MSMCRNRMNVRLASVVLGVGMCGSVAMAQSQPALKGPAVKDRDVPGVVGEFGSAGGQRRQAERLPAEAFRKALSVLTAADAAEAIRASDEQRAEFKTLVEEFESRVKEYRRANGKQIAELRKLGGEQVGAKDAKRPKGEQGNAGDTMQSMSEADQKARDEARAKLRELMEGAPKIEDVYTKVWAGLNESQRAAVDAEIATFREQQAKQREEQYVRQRVGKQNEPKGADAKPGAATDTKKPAGDGDDDMMKPSGVETAKKEGGASKLAERPLASRMSPERRERLMRILSQMTPEEQDQLLERLESRIKERVGGKGSAAAERAGKNVKPAPKPEEVNVPSSEEK